MAGIFVSYRRDDSQGFAGRLADDLADTMGKDLVFRDVEIPLGEEFAGVLQRAIAASDVLIVVIGPRWAAVSSSGAQSRLFEPNDWVRTEIEAAFEQDKHVVPVLVGGARMPALQQLPASIDRLARLQAAIMSDLHWDAEVEHLATRLRALCPALARSRPRSTTETSPAEVLSELGGRLLSSATSETYRRRQRRRHGMLWRLTRSVARELRKLASIAIFIALIYFGIRLFGDDAMLAGLDKVEARLQIGWSRFVDYFESQRP